MYAFTLILFTGGTAYIATEFNRIVREMVERTVFIVDDDEAVRDSLKVLLESYGMTVRDYESTAAFSSERPSSSPACLILDQHLAGNTGLDYLASLDGHRQGLTVILITGQADAQMRARAHRLGVFAFLEKPIADGDLLATVEGALAGSRSVASRSGC
jgi:two-component system, LuxR family, response regulator FixJ